MEPTSDETARTFRLEIVRAVPVGVLETVVGTFAVLIAVKVFHASDLAKEILVASTGAGLLLSLFIVPMLKGSGARVASLAALVNVVGGSGFVAAALNPGSLVWFVAGVGLGLLSFTLQIPLTTQIYRMNYPEAKRGKLFSVAGVVRAAVAIVASLAGGVFLMKWPGRFDLLLWFFAASCFWVAWCLWRLPHVGELRQAAGKRVALFSAFRWVVHDRAFCLLLASWMLMGMGNLAAMSVYVEYFASAERGVGLDEKVVALLSTGVPQAFKLMTTYFWGGFFDRANIYLLRIMQNVFCVLAVVLTFCGGPLWLMGMGMAAQGIQLGGGNVTWSLWVTKLAPREHVAEYMSVHTFLTGVRRFGAPFVAFPALTLLGAERFGYACGALIVVASLMLLPAALRARRGSSEG